MNIHAWALGLSCLHIYTMGMTPQPQQAPQQTPAPTQQPAPQNVTPATPAGGFKVDASGNAQLVVNYTVPVKTVGVDGKVIESTKTEDFVVNLGKLENFKLTPKEVAQKVKDGLSQKFKAMSDQDLLTRTGFASFGRDGDKWAIVLDERPFESYPKETVLVNSGDKMKDIYAKGLRATFTPAPQVSPQMSSPASAPAQPGTAPQQ